MRLVGFLHASVKMGNHEPVRNKDSQTLLVIKTCAIFIPVSKGSCASGSTEWKIFQQCRVTGPSAVGALVT